ncbi:hypothetical protein [Kangiella marina]|uniref:Lysozyme inhibitor LprI N-terminal domain-containing protein n=1 Tax=Kangiella marina TaxID=1079178 RepID=A0ABP8IEI7_9GAMM
MKITKKALSIVTFTVMLPFAAEAATDYRLLIKRDLEKLVGTSELYTEFEKSSCGDLLDKDFPNLVKKINTSIQEIETEVKPQYPKIWQEVTSEDSKAKQQAKKWVSHRIKKIPDLSSNQDFGCGVIFGELLSFGYRFERDRVSLMMHIRNASENQSEPTP